MKRSQAEDLIDRVRKMAANGRDGASIERMLRLQYGLEPLTPCPGEAHQNLFIDHCSQCSPRWGWLGEREPVT